MARIAHLSDLHLLERDLHRRSAADRVRVSFLSFGRSLDVDGRMRRLVHALDAYKASGAAHLVITGDLTEDGTDAQFELLAEILAESRIDPAQVTLTAGNHDGYQDPRAFERALQGPLRPFFRTSEAGRVTLLDDLAILPLSTVMPQHYARSAGFIPAEALSRASRIVRRLQDRRRAVAIAQHHAPFARPLPGYHWIDGLQNHQAALQLVTDHEHVHVLHGHEHRRLDRTHDVAQPPRVFGTTAVVDHQRPLRLYQACDGRLWPITPVTAPATTPSTRPGPCRNGHGGTELCQ